MIRPSAHSVRRWSLLFLAYLAAAVAVSWPLAAQLQDGLLGTPTMDQVDTAWLRLAAARWLTGQDPGIFAPMGFPLEALVPNWMDHILAAPLALSLPWPLADNLFWLLLITANGLAGHALGRQLGGSDGAGLLCGLGFALCEPLLREINASHAPQALMLWAPLFLGSLLRSLEAGGRLRHAAFAGLFLGLSALSYWYQGLFLAVLAAPVVVYALLRARREGSLGQLLPHLGVLAAVAGLLCVPLLAISVAAAPDLAGGGGQVLQQVPGLRGQPVPVQHAWTFLHGSGPGWLWRAEPIATASRLSVVLLVAAGWGAWRGSGPRWPWLVAAGLGGLLLMGPFLQLAGEPVLVAGRLVPLPGWALAEISDAAARLHWPLRWGVVVPLALLPLAVRAPRPALWGAALLVETLLLSGNAPLQVSPVEAFTGWRALAASPGPVLVLPQEMAGDGASTMGLIYRASGASLANELGVPPQAAQPITFRRWQESLALRRGWRQLRDTGNLGAAPPDAVAQLRAEGVAAVALDVTPGCTMSPEDHALIAEGLATWLGEPVDYGPALVWWIDAPASRPQAMDGAAAWRLEQHAALTAAHALRGRR